MTAYLPGVPGPVTRPLSAAPPQPPGVTSTPVSDADTGAGADTASTVGVSDSDTSTGADVASPIALSGADTGAGADTAASIAVSDSDTGAGAETGAVFAAVPSPPPGPVVGPDPFSVPAFASMPVPFNTTPPANGTPNDSDSGAAADTGVSIAFPAADTGAAADSGAVGVSDSDAGAAAETGSVAAAVSAADAGAAADTGAIGLADADTGAAAEAGSLPPPPIPPPQLIPPGLFNPMNFTALPVLPAPKPTFTPVSGTDTGAAAETGSVVSTTFPQIPLAVTAELDLAGTWTDITSYVLQRDSPTPVSIERGRKDEGTTAELSQAIFQVSNRDGRFTPLNPAGAWYGQISRNTPVRFSVPGTGGIFLRMEDDTASYVSAPDTAGLSITGDTEIQIDLQLSSYTSSTLASKYDDGSANRSWFLELKSTGILEFFWSPDGTNLSVVISTLPVPLGRIAIKVTLAVATGTVTFWTAPSISGTWTQLGAAASGTGGASTSVFDSTASLLIGFDPHLSTGLAGLTGRVYAFKLLSGIGGAVKASPDFTAQGTGTTSFADAQGNTWTLNGTAVITDRDYRFHGELSALPAAWDPTGTDVWTPVAAAGLLRRLGQGNTPLYSALTRGNLNLTGTSAPHAYWPCEDGQGATSLASGLPGGQPMNVSGIPATAFAGDSEFICSNPLPTINSSTWYGSVPAYTSHGSIVIRFLLNVTSPPAASNKVYLAAITSGTAQWIALYAGTGTFTNEFGLVAYNGSTLIFDTGTFQDVSLPASPTPVWFSIELTNGGGGTVNYNLVHLTPNGQTSGTILFSGSYSGVVGNVGAIQVNPGAASISAGLGQITVQSQQTNISNLAQQLFAWQGETAGNRFARLCGENGLQSRVYGIPGSSAAMGPQTPQDLMTLLQECEAADQGMIFEPRQVLALGYRTQAALCAQAPAVTLDYAAAELGGDGQADGLAPTYDDQYTKNDVIAQRSSGTGATSGSTARATLNDGSAMSVASPPAGIGEYGDSVSVNVATDAQLPDAAWWHVHLGTVDENRWPHVPVNMARAAINGGGGDTYSSTYTSGYGAALPAVQAVDVGDYVKILNPPAWLPPDTIRQIAAGSTEVLGGYHWTIAWHCVPESPYEVALYDDATYGRADTDGSTLAASASSGATTLSVASAGIVWTQAPADFPFDIAVDGERMTVTNITSASSPQAFTVTRSVNGVVKAHSSGADVRLWFPPVYGLT